LVRFIENHDEPRAAASFSPEEHRTAAVLIGTLPGARLYHEGQFEGRKVRLPVFLGRRPDEPADKELENFYKRLLAATASPVFGSGEWSLCERSGWADNLSYQNLVAWSWEKEDERRLIVVNLSDGNVQARVRMPIPGMEGKTLTLVDLLSGARYDRSADEIQGEGVYVELGPWGIHFLECRLATRVAAAGRV
jgi:hypothetical protein